jgi:hypothetical protein
MIAVLITSFFSTSAVEAQGVLAEIHGTVADSTGSVIPNATIVIVDDTKGWRRQVVSNGQGEYTLPELEADSVTLTVNATGFRQSVRQGIKLQTGQQARVDFSLLNGEASDVVTVTADAALLQSSDATIGAVVDQRKIVELPLNGRNFFQLAQLVPNVFPPITGSSLSFRGGFNVAGQAEVNNNYLLDGIDNSDEATMQPTVSPSIDGIQEFKLLTGVYSAEYGRFSGGQILITTKSGSNSIHGSAYEFYRTSALDAKNYFSPGTVPPFKRNQYGFSIGGPIKKDHTFYFGTYEGLRLSQQISALATVPTLAERGGNLSDLASKYPKGILNPQTGVAYPNYQLPAINTVASKLLQFFPLPTSSGTANNYIFSEIRTQQQDQFSTRIDQTLWRGNTIFGSYQYQLLNAFEPSNSLCGSSVLPDFGCNTPELDQAFAIHDTQVLSSAMVNEFRIGYNRVRTNRALEDAKFGDVDSQLGIPTNTDNGVGEQSGLNLGVPRVTITGYSVLGGATNLPQGRRDNTYNVVDSLSWVKGKHALKFGGDFKRFIYNLQYYQDGRGVFTFNGQYTTSPLADFLLGNLYTTTRDPGYPGVNSFTASSDYYALDQYQISPRVTLTYGLRYELDFPEGERKNRIASFDPATGYIPVADGRLLNLSTTTGALVSVGSNPLIGQVWRLRKTNLAPRVSVSIQPFDQKTTIRAGFGILYNEVTAGNGISQLWRGLPFRTLQTFTNSNSSTYPKPAPAASWSNPFPSGVTNAGGYTPAGINSNYKTAGVQQWSISIDRELQKDLALEVTYLGSHGTNLQESYNINQPTPAAGAVQARRPYPQWGPITYVNSNGGSSFNSFSAQLTRRYSQGLTLLSSYTYSHSLDDAPYSGFIQNPLNLASQWASSDFDIKHRSVTSFTYELPFGTGRRFGAAWKNAPRQAISGWQINGIFSFQSGLPFTVTTTKDIANVGLSSSYAQLVPGQNPRSSNPTPAQWFNTAAFTDTLYPTGGTPVYAYGNASRNLLRQDGANNLDAGVYRRVPIHKAMQVELRFETYNILNHPSFAAPTANIQSTSFGTVSSTTSTARQTQFAAKFLF